MAENITQKSFPNIGRKIFISCIIIAIAAIAITWQMTSSKKEVSSNHIAFPKHFKMSQNLKPVESFVVDLTSQIVSTTPTTNPADPYDPMPLRVGTVGATVYHRPFCLYAKQSLANHGLEKRINYWSREQVASSGRPADDYCLAGSFDCSDRTPESFAASGNDPWCGANVRRDLVSGIPPGVVGKTLCSLQGYLGVFVDNPQNCQDGSVRASSSYCNQEVCSACTTDCDTACAGCTRITLAYFNNITLSLGDGNKDGDTDVDDYLYYHECYSGSSVAATVPCQNVFDYDNNTDVDIHDFDLFVQSYNTGNTDWAIENHPDVTLGYQTELPLRVGTEGASYYHRLNCSSVNVSWQTHGIDKRVDFYTWDQVEASGRISDSSVCLAGDRHNPSGSLQNCALDDDGDETFNCEDECPENARKTEPGVCGCIYLDTDTDSDGTPDCIDNCPNDPDKTEPGNCGCEVIEADPCP
ncbi:MAG: hypothetical protein ACXAC5_02620 [Promethearchaeota archaeon]|jgi:hypothetical protein